MFARPSLHLISFNETCTILPALLEVLQDRLAADGVGGVSVLLVDCGNSQTL
jgi:hypothetical protein